MASARVLSRRRAQEADERESGMTEIKSGSMLASVRVVSVGRVHESDERGSGGEWTRVRGEVRKRDERARGRNTEWRGAEIGS